MGNIKAKRVYSELWEKWVVIFTDLITNKTTIQKCDTEQDAIEFQNSLETSIPLPWYLK